MILILSGEGKTDMGHTVPEATGEVFKPGPMARIVDRLLELKLGYSLLETNAAGGRCVCCVPEAELRPKKKTGPMRLPGFKYGKENAFYTANAQYLGLRAIKEAEKVKDDVIAVLFRDGDGNHSATQKEWQQKVDSIKRGFKAVSFEYGVPMVPRPKSEAWLICALKPDAYRNCTKLEDESGNDASPNSLKRQLEQLVGHAPSAEEQTEWVAQGKVDPLRIEMPSFMAFREDLNSLGSGLASWDCTTI